MEDLKGFKKLVLKLLVPFCFDVFTIELDFLAWNITMTFYSFVMGSFCSFYT